MSDDRTVTWQEDVALRAAVLAAIVALWWLATTLADSIFFPGPTDVLAAAWNDWLFNAEAWTENIIPSMIRLAFGFVLAAVVSVALGVVVGRSQAAAEYLEPIIHFVRAIPPPALLPLLLILLGIGDIQKTVLIAIGVAPPILLNTIDGIRGVERLHLETAVAYQIPATSRLTHVVLPAASPKIFAGLRISLSVALILMVISELVAATDGLGFRLIQASTTFAYVDLWAGLVVLGLLGITLNAALAQIERRVLRWQVLAR
jgi:ABC-type nitrate/sulfonate/bicarbonate transport system permease component